MICSWDKMETIAKKYMVHLVFQHQQMLKNKSMIYKPMVMENFLYVSQKHSIHFLLTLSNAELHQIMKYLLKVRLSAGAEFIVMVCGDIMTMPGLPKVPAAERIDIDDDGNIVGLF